MIQEDQKVTLLGITIWLLASIFFLYEFFLRTFIGSVANQVMQDFSLTVGTFAWVTSAYYFSYAFMQIPVGILIDKFGVKKVLIFATCTCAFSCFLFSHSHSFLLAFISRLIMGFGSAFGFISLLVVAASWFPRKYNGLVSGASQFFGTLGPVLAAGPMVSFLIDSKVSWQHLIDIIGTIGALLAFIMLMVIRNKNRDGKKFTIYLRKEQPLRACLKALGKNPQVWWITIYSGIVYVPMTLLASAWGVPYIESLDFSHAEAASVISITWIGYALGALSFGTVSDKLGKRRPILVFAALNNIVLILLMLFLPVQSIYFYDAIFLLLGFGCAGQSIAFSTIAENVDFATKATAMGINNTGISLLSSTAPIIAGYLIHAGRSINAATLQPDDFFNSFMIIPILSSIAAIIALFLIKETFCKMQKGPIILKVNYTLNEN